MSDTPWLTLPDPVPPGRGRRPPWGLIVALGCALLVVLVAVVATLVAVSAGRGTLDEEQAGPVGPGAQGDLPVLPPSERGELPATTLPAVVDRQDLSSEAARSGAAFSELTCTFTGTSRLDRPLSMDALGSAVPNRMTLEPGARFACTADQETSAGTITLDAAFDSLSALAGLGSGTGTIAWSELPPARRVPGELAPTSRTGVEVQLELPVIVVWTTILDGPYAGFRGRLVLRDWDPIFDESGDISGIRFATTATTFSPG
jgi:hypothetical protein